MMPGNNPLMTAIGVGMIFILILSAVPGSLASAQETTGQNATSGPGFWITFDPIPDLPVGSLVTIKGSTNYPEGMDLHLLVTNAECEPYRPQLCTVFRPVNTTVFGISSEPRNIRFFSVIVNSSGYPPGTYIIDELYGAMVFNLTANSGFRTDGQPETPGQTTRPQQASFDLYPAILAVCLVVLARKC